MASVGREVAFLTVIVLFLQQSYAAIYKVGDSAGWTTIGNVDYKQWAATKTFQVGDIIRFEYNAQFHNVMRVTHAMYRACNASAPMATYTTGNDSITIKSKGHHYFFCGVPGHCQAGQKVDINVLRTSSEAPGPSPVPFELSPPSVPAASVPAPSPSSAVSWKALNGIQSNIGLTVALSAVFASGFA